MLHLSRRAAAIALAAVLGTGLLGGAAFAAFAPRSDATSSIDPAGVAAASDQSQGADAQMDALARPAARRAIVVGRLFRESASYLGIAPKDLRARLVGTSLGAIADATAGKSRAGLVADLVSFANAAVDKALSEGRITKAQADKLKAAIPQRIARFVDHVWRAPRHHHGVGAFLRDAMKDARTYLGLSQKDIAAGLHAGKSLGQIADATPGKSRAGLIAAITDGANSRISKALADGKLTATQADRLRTALTNAVTKLVDHTRAPRTTGDGATKTSG